MPNLPRLPDYVPGRPVQGGSGRISARAANDLERTARERTVTIGAAGKLLPIAFGRRDIPGKMFTWKKHDGDLYVGVLWCIGECQEIEAVYIDDEALPGSGVTVTHYLGTDSQGVDPSLSAAIAAYNDTMRVNVDGTWVGICYSVFVIEPNVLDGFPRSFRAVGKWRKVWDPRTSTRIFSENAALIGRELITDPIIGLGLPVTGDVACANWSDELLGGTIPRGRVSFVMDSARDLYRSWLPLIAEYGEFFYDLSGAGINMTPDAPSWFVPEREPEQVEELVSGAHGTNGGGVFKGSAGRHGLSFEAADYVLSDFSISATAWLIEVRLLWNKPASGPAYIYDQSDRFVVDLNGAFGPGTGNIQVWAGGDWQASTVAAKDAEWCLYSFHYRADETVDIYLDGAHAGSVSGIQPKDLANLWIMIATGGTSFGAAGIVSEFRIWDVGGMTTGQVADHVAQYAETERLNGDESGLRIYYPMDDIPAIKARDVISQPDGRSGMTMVAEPGSDTPTVVEVRYTVPATDGKPWGTATEPRQLPGVESGEVPRIPTSVGLEGVFRAPDAANRALARLNRLRNRINITWTTRDYGIEHHRGRVVEIQRPDIGIETYARVMQVDYAGPGRYQVIAQRYSDDQHPSELQLPEDTTTVPVGAIALTALGTNPDGWESYTAANGRYLMGADYVALSPGATGGTTTTSISGDVAIGTHTGTGEFAAACIAFDGTSSAKVTCSLNAAGGHQHGYSATITPDPARRNYRLVRKITSPGIEIPSGVETFGMPGLSHPDYSRIITHAGRLVRAEASAGTAGGPHTAPVTIASADDTHAHAAVVQGTTSLDFGPCPSIYQALEGGGSHAHELNAQIEARLKRVMVAVYGGGARPVIPAVIFGWAGTQGDIPTDWVLCDGTNGAPDFAEHFIEITSGGISYAGNNTIRAHGTSSSVGHSHRGSLLNESGCLEYQTTRHADTEWHNHAIDDTAAWTAPYFALAFIMYQPGQ